MMYLNSSYMDGVYRPEQLQTTVTRVAEKLKKLQKKLKFTHVVFTGSSGASIAYPVSMLTAIELMYIRKTDENSHGNSIEGNGEVCRYIILDDFIATGATIRRMLKSVKDNSRGGKPPTCVGIALYNDEERSRRKFEKIAVHYV